VSIAKKNIRVADIIWTHDRLCDLAVCIDRIKKRLVHKSLFSLKLYRDVLTWTGKSWSLALFLQEDFFLSRYSCDPQTYTNSSNARDSLVNLLINCDNLVYVQR